MNKVNAIPEGMHSLTPHLVCRDAAAAIDFYGRAFGAIEQFRLPMPDGKIMHACVQIGDSKLFLFDEMPEHGAFGPQDLKSTPVTIHLQVQDADAVFARAVAAGATMTMPLAEMFWGDRYGRVRDPFGHHWSIATHTRDLSPEQIRDAAATSMGSCPQESAH
ncbi:VOC family protein [Sulfuriferula nivalis]|uniref:Glyoxalase n=1 Tax=Sulfuriferula nivalis TaxID=2675298 RepID=A0A809SFI2_9PROT|nr:VOC family protein [Sulfuriferula nivalis]BBP02287.1 glyoxalase [Sulfuriferula nivalis]